MRRYSKFKNYDRFGIRSQIIRIVFVSFIEVIILVIIDICLRLTDNIDKFIIWFCALGLFLLYFIYLDVAFVLKQEKKRQKIRDINISKQTKQLRQQLTLDASSSKSHSKSKSKSKSTASPKGNKTASPPPSLVPKQQKQKSIEISGDGDEDEDENNNFVDCNYNDNNDNNDQYHLSASASPIGSPHAQQVQLPPCTTITMQDIGIFQLLNGVDGTRVQVSPTSGDKAYTSIPVPVASSQQAKRVISSVSAISTATAAAMRTRMYSLAESIIGGEDKVHVENDYNGIDGILIVKDVNEIDKIENMRSWIEIVRSSFGYQLFINYLELEFSVENLLFMTEVCIYYVS